MLRGAVQWAPALAAAGAAVASLRVALDKASGTERPILHNAAAGASVSALAGLKINGSSKSICVLVA